MYDWYKAKCEMEQKEAMRKSYKETNKLVERQTESIKANLKELENSKTIEEYMTTKKKLMMEILNMIPLGTSNCPFCHIYYAIKEICNYCPYGKKHGICGDPNSSYSRLIQSHIGLKAKIFDYWKEEHVQK